MEEKRDLQAPLHGYELVEASIVDILFQKLLEASRNFFRALYKGCPAHDKSSANNLQRKEEEKRNTIDPRSLQGRSGFQ